MTLEPAAAAHQPHHQEQDDGADGGIDDLGHEAGAEMDAELREQEDCDKRAGAMPITISPMMPNPLPRTTLPASQPATRPTNRMTMRPWPEMYIS